MLLLIVGCFLIKIIGNTGNKSNKNISISLNLTFIGFWYALLLILIQCLCLNFININNDSADYITKLIDGSKWWLAIVCILTPIYEELFYRYFWFEVFSRLFKVKNYIVVIVLTSVIFALSHTFVLSLFLLYFLLSSVLSYIYYRYNNILLNMIIHSYMNTIVVFFYLMF